MLICNNMALKESGRSQNKTKSTSKQDIQHIP